MASRIYPIWIEVEACIYKSKKSYGVKDTNDQRILVGSGPNNSHELCRIINYKKEYDEYKGHEKVIVFKTKVDGIILKEMIFKDNKGRAGELIEVNQFLLNDRELS